LIGGAASSARAGGSLTALGDLPGGSVGSNANGVSGDGSVVVGFGNIASGDEAFIWTAGGGKQRLWDVLLANGIDPAASGWTSLISATGVSADGTAIADYGTRNGNTRRLPRRSSRAGLAHAAEPRRARAASPPRRERRAVG
jgi:uncharacterized membrane protein